MRRLVRLAPSLIEAEDGERYVLWAAAGDARVRQGHQVWPAPPPPPDADWLQALAPLPPTHSRCMAPVVKQCLTPDGPCDKVK